MKIPWFGSQTGDFVFCLWNAVWIFSKCFNRNFQYSSSTESKISAVSFGFLVTYINTKFIFVLRACLNFIKINFPGPKGCN